MGHRGFKQYKIFTSEGDENVFLDRLITVPGMGSVFVIQHEVDRLSEFWLQVMMQTIRLAWSYPKVIYKYLSQDTSEIGVCIPNICIFQNDRKKPPEKSQILYLSCSKLQFGVQMYIQMVKKLN